MTDTAVRPLGRGVQLASRASARPGHRGRVPGGSGHHGGRRAADRHGPVRLLRAGGAPQGRRAGREPRTADRRLRAFLVNTGTGESTDVVVSLTHHEVISARTLDPRTDGQLPILDSDFIAVDEIVKADPDWRAAMARRGYRGPQPDPRLPDHGGRVRGGRRRPAADGARARVPPGPGARPGLGAPGRRHRRLRRPDREESLQDHRRVRAAGAGRIRRLRRRGRARPAAHDAQTHRDHPAGGARASPWTATRCAGRTGRCGSASTPARG
jgi:hypothetical protein